jgi:preprotein translocase subunit SecG
MVRFVLILFFVFFLLRIITRYILRSYLKNVKQNFDNQQNKHDQKKEGDVTVNTKADQSKIIKKDEGDYIDYEEIK